MIETDELLKITPELIQKFKLWLDGWKGLANYYGVTVRTLQRWDKLLKIPFERTGDSKRNLVRIQILVADAYYSTKKKHLNYVRGGK